MNTVFYDADVDDEKRRQQLYDGALHVYSPTSSSVALCKFAHELADEAFSPHSPEFAQEHLPVEKYVEILAQLKPKFIHHVRCKELIRGLLSDLGCDVDEDVFRRAAPSHYDKRQLSDGGPGVRVSPTSRHMVFGPTDQLNWWIPVYEISPENTIAFFPRYWNRPITNSSREYNYYKWNQESRRQAATQIKTDTRKQPEALEPLDMDFADPRCLQGGRHHPLFRRLFARDRAEHVGPHPV